LSAASDRTRRLVERLFGPEAQAAIEAFAQTRVNVVVGDRPGDQIAAALCLILLLRLDEAAPTIAVDGPSARSVALPLMGERPLVDELATQHAGFASLDRFSRGRLNHADIEISFGAKSSGLNISSAGWVAAVAEPIDGPPAHPIAAAYSGVLAAIETFKVALGHAGVQRRIVPWRGSISLWDWTLAGDFGPTTVSTLELPDGAWIGAGGIGSPAAWALSLVPLSGKVAVVDPDLIDGSSLNRHLTAAFANLGDAKAVLLADMLGAAGAQADAVVDRWQAARVNIGQTSLAVVSVDDDPTRRDIQFDMPRRVLNAGTNDDGLYRVSAHDFLSGACLACISRSDRAARDLVDSVATLLGIDPGRLRPYTRSSQPLPAEILADAAVDAATKSLLATVPGVRLLETVCATVRVDPTAPALSAPMLSAAPGVLLAAAVAREALGNGLAPGLDVRSSMFTGPHARWQHQLDKVPDCPCRDEVYRAHFAELW
jgi:hypothetical protein